MESQVEDQLRKLSRDDASFQKLKELFGEVREETEKHKNYLELLESTIENDYDSILITEINLEKPGPKIVYVNDGFCKMTGYSREEVIGKTPRILQGPKTDRAVLDKLKERLTRGQSFFGKAINYRKDGSEFVNQWDIHPLTDEEGNLTHWVSYQHDITERKRSEKMLVDAQVEFDSLREQSRRTILDVDLEGNIVMANKSFRDLIGYDKDDLKQMKVWELFPRKYRDSLKSRFDGGMQKEEFDRQQFKGIIKHQAGFPIQVEGSTKLMELQDRTLLRAEVRNISLQKRILETLQRRNEKYTKIFEKVSEFTYSLKLMDGEMVFDRLSEEFPELTGLSPQKIKQEGGLYELVHEEDIDNVIAHFKTIFEGKDCTCEYRIRGKHGDYLPVIDYGKPKWDDSSQEVVSARGAITVKSG